MGTLYDLLGALPDDNAEGLRTAFRKAAKATHPDLNPDNPEAALRFRQLVRAHGILSDAEQRATYDQLLAIALKPVPTKSTQVYEKVHRFASSTIAATIIAGILVASYTLMGLVSRAPVAAESTVGIASRPPPIIVAATSPSDMADNERRESTALADEVFTTGVVAPIANARGPWIAGAGPVPHVAISGVKSYREPNVFASRGGRKYATPAGLDLAIQRDLGFAAAYLNGKLPLYSARDVSRAFADMEDMRRVAKAKQAKAARRSAPLEILYVPVRRANVVAAVTP
jgi:DnaJ domain